MDYLLSREFESSVFRRKDGRSFLQDSCYSSLVESKTFLGFRMKNACWRALFNI